MQSLYGTLFRRQNLNISHFKSNLAYLAVTESKTHGLTLLNSNSSPPNRFPASMTQPFRSSHYFSPKFGTQTETATFLNGNGRSCRMNLSCYRSMTTVGNPAEASSEDSSAPVADVPPRIKFKRLDKTARHIMQILNKEAVEEVRGQREIPDIKPGYTVRLKVEVPENKRRVSTIIGTVIARRNAGIHTTFRLRRMVAGVGVESLLPLYSPNIKQIEVLDDRKKVRRAKLYYLRDRMNALKKR
ncbi:50S ribosomal protein L19-1 [Populus alba x Populus x berolinensis]|nr:50S ribosomal protein L19-1 [Populus alba x Populus x berolinensis]